ncbi:S24 family peptidase [Motilimonas cestriensis]|uniref:S24 family peptidase n=1 Tax=Motilimonas cestriensis TaxID=2742685 RepID=A0ABS8W9K8_9GAMM|nr:S24 family peptidase [Motilimonas cestriensis]MCE2594441.1 S24 family peptidase [Motilimonas cestriensis]
MSSGPREDKLVDTPQKDDTSLCGGKKRTLKQEWYTAQDLHGIRGMPTTARRTRDTLERLVDGNDDLKRKRTGTKATEYHESILPRETKLALGYSALALTESNVVVTNLNNLVQIPQYSVKASAGGGLAVEEENIIGQISVGKDWLYKQKLNNLNLALIEVSGDSMEPTLSDGDLAMISLIKPCCTEKVEGIYIFSIDGEVRIKRLTKDLSKRGYHLRSDNQLFGNDYIEESELHRMNIIGKLKKVLKSVK